jgi:hypothetical protein
MYALPVFSALMAVNFPDFSAHPGKNLQNLTRVKARGGPPHLAWSSSDAT